jgi:hypothetical protein
VYAKIADDEFSRREIPTDMPVGREGEFVVPADAFVEPQQPIVVKGGQMLLSEEFRAQIQVEGDDD